MVLSCALLWRAVQVLKDGAPGVAPGGETRKQNWCCELSGKLQQHFDISYYAFEKLVHPVYGEFQVTLVQSYGADVQQNVA